MILFMPPRRQVVASRNAASILAVRVLGLPNKGSEWTHVDQHFELGGHIQHNTVSRTPRRQVEGSLFNDLFTQETGAIRLINRVQQRITMRCAHALQGTRLRMHVEGTLRLEFHGRD